MALLGEGEDLIAGTLLQDYGTCISMCYTQNKVNNQLPAEFTHTSYSFHQVCSIHWNPTTSPAVNFMHVLSSRH